MHLKKITALCTSALLALGLGVVGVGLAAPAAATQPDFICEGYDSGKIDTVGDPATVEVTAPAGKLISGYCVKAGTEKFFIEVNPPSKTVVVDHPTKDSVSHYSLVYVNEPVTPITVRVNLTYIMDCAPDLYNTWRVRNPHTESITVTWRNAGNTLSGTHTATPGDSFFETPRGSETMIISWGGGDTSIVAGTQTKASGNDVAASDPKCKPDDKVEYGDWVVGEYDCDDTMVTETREVYTTTYSLVDGKWTGNTVTTSESRERELTAEEIDALFCPDPEPETKVEYGEWVTGEYDCDDTQVTETRTVTTTTYTLVGEEWVANDPQISQEARIRDLTEQEIDELFCPGPQPEDKVVTGEWVDGTYDCGDTRVEQTRTVTTTPYVLEGETWVEGESTSVTETQTRDLTAAELLALKCPDNLAQTGAGEWIGGALLAALLMLGLGAVPVARAIRNKA